MPGNIDDAVTLHNGVRLPMLGFGTWQVPEGPAVEQAVRTALELGYRHVDTAALYGNERGVGRAIAAGGVPRDQVFVTTKVWNDKVRQGYDAVLRAFDESLKKLAMDHVDLYLIHWAVPGKYKEAWRALERVYADGRARAIGVSNFAEHHLADVMRDATVKPMVNQVELHPKLLQPNLLAFCRQNGIAVEAWSPLMQGKIDTVPEVVAIAAALGVSAGQVALRWNLQHGVVTIPKSTNPDRMPAERRFVRVRADGRADGGDRRPRQQRADGAGHGQRDVLTLTRRRYSPAADGRARAARARPVKSNDRRERRRPVEPAHSRRAAGALLLYTVRMTLSV